MSVDNYPLSPVNELRALYIDKSLNDIPVPAAVIDIAKVKENCKLMLNAISQLNVSFRAHIKTHKTTELTRLQVGQDCKDVRLIVSTVIEAEHLVTLLLEYKAKGSKVNVLYGVPLGRSHVQRLAAVAKQLGEGSVAVMIDNAAQLESLTEFYRLTGFPAAVFIKTDSGYHRAGLHPMSEDMINLVNSLSAADSAGEVDLLGWYSHNSLSYGGSNPDDAMEMLNNEIDVCRQASQHLKSKRSRPLVVSVGASPSALSIQNILPSSSSNSSSAKKLQESLQLTKSNLELEIHAGVYPLFDIQQVSAGSRDFAMDPHNAIAVTVLGEICSLYPKRTENPEALMSAGCLALGREPCKGYAGWGVLSPWGMTPEYSIERNERIIVNRISQEHGILARENSSNQDPLPLQYGQKVRIWPNHACITLAMFGWYLVVDSSQGKPDTVVDVYQRWRGW